MHSEEEGFGRGIPFLIWESGVLPLEILKIQVQIMVNF